MMIFNKSELTQKVSIDPFEVILALTLSFKLL